LGLTKWETKKCVHDLFDHIGRFGDSLWMNLTRKSSDVRRKQKTVKKSVRGFHEKSILNFNVEKNENEIFPESFFRVYGFKMD